MFYRPKSNSDAAAEEYIIVYLLSYIIKIINLSMFGAIPITIMLLM